ncbi:flagellar biosynthesis protein FlhF [Fontibacillus panacisegetis]|uniref:Flagellar biosynthesis protein FlhF n=1 Tax=Fontibacillus panacisegetis TaxID=670482 RepID=A0A1G7F0N6_9BACL|nr:flagellar biosynthesis protein FlhF [Fontibacillus panacisegetis]SDE69286.1 flagellar biosynthesis protein FlhF [Fontibacillus panacisegetis]
MRVKRYIVDTMPDAMLKIRSELGADAVILSTKEMKIGGFLGMFQKKKIEVIAASEGNDKPAPKVNVPRPVVSSSPQVAVARQSVPEAYRRTSQMTSGSGVGATSNEELNVPLIPKKDESAVKKWEDTLRKSLEDEYQNPVQTTEHVSTVVDQSYRLKEEQLLSEIREMKSWIGQLAKQQKGDLELPKALDAIKNRMLEQEISAELVDNWIDKTYQKWIDSDKSISDDELERQVRQQLGSFLEERIGEGIGENTRIVYIAGPTGVGKTTTIAKLAADQIFRVRKKVGFITADTYRISAVEQLRTYASILNVPLEVVQSPGDVQRAFQRLDDCDLILMDTAGRNYLNEIYVAELHSLLSPSEQSETYLVLSLTSKAQDMKKIAEHFSRYGLDKVIFTKLDETESVGPMFNLMNDYPVKLSYITNGQNVPDDLLLSNQNMLIDMIMGEFSS